MASVTDRRPGVVTRTSAFFFRHRHVRLGLTLGLPTLWFLVIYIGALAILFVSAFWSLDVFTGEIVHAWTLKNFQTLLEDPVYRVITLRTVGLAAAVTVSDIVLAFPLAYYAARLASNRARNAVLVAVVIPLWANYLVRVFAWKLILTPTGFLNWFTEKVGISLQLGNSNWAIWLTFVYLWLPFTMLPIYGALERVPNSLPRGVRRPRGEGMAHVPPRGRPDDHPRHRGGFDLLVLAHARRLHRAEPRREHEVHRQRDLRQRGRREQHPLRCGVSRSCPWRSWRSI